MRRRCRAHARYRLVIVVAVAAVVSVPAASASASPREPCVPEPMPTGYSEQIPPDAAAVVAGAPVEIATLEGLLDQARHSYARQKRAFPAKGTRPYRLLQNQALLYLVRRAEFDQVAVQLGIEITTAQVDRRLAQIKKQFFGGSEARFRAELRKNGLTLEQLLEDIRGQLVTERLYGEVTGCLQVTEADAEAYYQSHQDQYRRPESRTVRHILVKGRVLAEELYRRLKAGASFAALARKYSLDPGSKNGGGRLVVVRGQTVPAFNRVAFRLETGELSKPVKTQYGWHVVQALSDIVPATRQSFDEVREVIEQQLLAELRTRALQEWQAAVERNWKPTVFYARGYKP